MPEIGWRKGACDTLHSSYLVSPDAELPPDKKPAHIFLIL